MFSVIIPLYNKEFSVGKTIESVLIQTFEEFEIVIVNDGSTDNSLEVIQQFNDSRIKIIDKSNGGVSSARNRGVKEAKYDWVCFLDADDLWMEGHLETLIQMIEQFSQYRVFSASYVVSDEEFIHIQDSSVIIIEDYFKEAIKRHFFWTSVTCIHASVFDDVGDFDINLNRGEDLELWARIGRKYSFVRSKKITGIYRIDAENRSNLKFNLEKSRVFNYEFSSCESSSEREYYKKQISNTLRSFIMQKKIMQFIKLKTKHKSFISFKDIIKR